MKIGDLVRFTRFTHHSYSGKIGMIVSIELSHWRNRNPDPALTSYKILLGDKYFWVSASAVEKYEETV